MTAAAPEQASPTAGPDSMTRQGKADYEAKKKGEERRAREAEVRAQDKKRRKRNAANQEPVVEPVEPIVPDDTITDEQAIANKAVEAAKARAKKMRTGTQTVLTSPLGAIASANTAVARLGGA